MPCFRAKVEGIGGLPGEALYSATSQALNIFTLFNSLAGTDFAFYPIERSTREGGFS